MHFAHVDALDCGDKVFELGLVQRTSLREHKDVFAESHDGWNRGDIRGASQALFCFGIHLGKNNIAELLGSLLVYRRKIAAWSAPGSPEVHQDDVVLINQLREFVFAHIFRCHGYTVADPYLKYVER